MYSAIRVICRSALRSSPRLARPISATRHWEATGVAANAAGVRIGAGPSQQRLAKDRLRAGCQLGAYRSGGECCSGERRLIGRASLCLQMERSGA